MRKFVLIYFSLSFACLMIACGHSKIESTRTDEDKIHMVHSQLNHALDLARKLPRDTTSEHLQKKIAPVLKEIARATNSEKKQVVEAIQVLREHPQGFIALKGIYESLPRSEYTQRVLILAVVGEMRQSDSIHFLKSIVWSALPESPTQSGCGLGNGEREGLVQRKAIQAIAYLRTGESDKEMLRIIKDHSSYPLRIAAIDAYLWNHQDNQEVQKQLYSLLPSELHKYVGMPRIHRGMNREEFKRRLSAWRKRWAQPSIEKSNP